MENITLTLMYVGGLILFFYVASLIGHILKLDKYIKEHPNHSDKITSK